MKMHQAAGQIQNYDPSQPRAPKGTSEGGQWTQADLWAAPGDVYREYNRDSVHRIVGGIGTVNLTEDHIGALVLYKGIGARLMNDYLRKGEVDDEDTEMMLQATIETIDDAMLEKAVDENIIVWRGIGDGIIPSDSIGLEIVDAGYMSTTVDEPYSWTWAGSGTGTTPTVLMIQVPAGTPGIWMESARIRKELGDAIPDEAEILLQRGSRMVVVDDQIDFSGRRIITVRIKP